MLAGRAFLLTTPSAIRVRSASNPCAKTCAIHVRSMCDPPAILVRSASFLRDPGDIRPIFYKRSCASTYPSYNTKGEVVLLGVVFTSLTFLSLEIYLRLCRAILEFYLGCCFALPLESSSQPPKVVKCKLKLNSSLTVGNLFLVEDLCSTTCRAKACFQTRLKISCSFDGERFALSAFRNKGQTASPVD